MKDHELTKAAWRYLAVLLLGISYLAFADGSPVPRTLNQMKKGLLTLEECC